MSSPTTPDRASTRGATLTDWRPEDAAFWADTGRTVARRNLVWSIVAENLGFSVWLFWSVSAAMLAKMGFAFSVQQLFFLVALPNLVGSLLRLPYTFAVPRFGGRTWTTISSLLLLLPTVLFAVMVQHPATPYWVFILIAATAGVGGGNFASSMANINFFFPARLKGTALGLNAAGGNLGVGMVQLLLPVIVGGAGIFGLVKASPDGIRLDRAGWLYAGLAVVAAFCAFRWMNDLSVSRSRARGLVPVLRQKHTWVMSVLYLGTFGSFIGYSAAMPLLIRISFWNQPLPGVEGIGINFAFYAFLGGTVGSVARPLGGWLADRFGGARVTLWSFGAISAGTLGVLATLAALRPVPAQDISDQARFTYSAAVRAAVDHNSALFPLFLIAFVFVFAATGVGNGSAYRMIPLIWQHDAERRTRAGTPARAEALARATRESSGALGIVGSVGALGGFGIPLAFGAPWIDAPVQAVKVAFVVFTGYYALCMAITWFVYTRTAFVSRVPSLAHAGV